VRGTHCFIGEKPHSFNRILRRFSKAAQRFGVCGDASTKALGRAVPEQRSEIRDFSFCARSGGDSKTNCHSRQRDGLVSKLAFPGAESLRLITLHRANLLMSTEVAIVAINICLADVKFASGETYIGGRHDLRLT
jgi:hypothetical protein